MCGYRIGGSGRPSSGVGIGGRVWRSLTEFCKDRLSVPRPEPFTQPLLELLRKVVDPCVTSPSNPDQTRTPSQGPPRSHLKITPVSHKRKQKPSGTRDRVPVSRRKNRSVTIVTIIFWELCHEWYTVGEVGVPVVQGEVPPSITLTPHPLPWTMEE